MTESKTNQLILEIEKLDRYIIMYASRDCNISHALGITGSNYLHNIVLLAGEIKQAKGVVVCKSGLSGCNRINCSGIYHDNKAP